MPNSISMKKRWEIVFLSTHPLGPKLSQPKIATAVKCSVDTVKFWLKRYHDTGDVQEITQSGRPPITSVKTDRLIEKIQDKNPELTSGAISDKLKRKGVQISERTVRRRLVQAGFIFGETLKKPLLSERHCEKKLKWARENRNRSWDNIIFSDETTIRLNVYRKKVWHRAGRRVVVRTVKHPAKLNIWGCMSSKGFGKIFTFTSNLDRFKMVEIYNKTLLPSILKFGGSNTDWILQEDNDPKHTSKLAKNWRAENNVERLIWPAQSPDQNPIENVWHVLKIRVCNEKPENLKELVRAVKKHWSRLSNEYAKKLVDSMNKRVQAVIESKGDYTMY